MSYFPQTTRATIGRRAPQTQRRYGNGPESMSLNSHPSKRIPSTMSTTSAPEPEQYQPQDDRFDIDMSSVMATEGEMHRQLMAKVDRMGEKIDLARQQASKNEQSLQSIMQEIHSFVASSKHLIEEVNNLVSMAQVVEEQEPPSIESFNMP
ncbi:hypothetical protein B0J13DRAFT_569576 [Dactylonectria estremocensis]|uniref:Uncharacterized protein n=1 Tax=Dactylonectria estremocensis TaxID=1079267 RepID=A0A9P9DGR0_9HYPO|nr:hypothetical protein B0J13DRAFT_569576 [Dactylonectria estremocensis]